MSGYARIAIITGATSGIGEATARKFVAAGFGVIGNGRNAAKLGELESELGRHSAGLPATRPAAPWWTSFSPRPSSTSENRPASPLPMRDAAWAARSRTPICPSSRKC